MVASKRGRGAKAQQAKAKAAAAAAEEPQAVPEAEPEVTEMLDAPENNGDSEQMEQSQDEEAAVEGGNEGDAEVNESQEGDQAAANADGEEQSEEKKEEKVESGKILVENLPSSFLFDYQEKLKELFSKHGEIISVKRGPIIVTELTTTPTLSAIVEFKNKDSLEKALCEDGTVVEGQPLSVAAESRADTAVLVGVPYEASNDYVRLLFAQCGEVTHIHEFSKTKYKILRVTFVGKEGVEKALKLDRELRINGFLVTVSKYRDDDDHKAHNNNKINNKRQHPQNQNRNSAPANNAAPQNNRNNNNFRPHHPPQNNFSPRGNYIRGGRGGRGGFARGGFARPFAPPPVNTYMPPQGYMGRPGGFMNDGQRPNKRLRRM